MECWFWSLRVQAFNALGLLIFLVLELLNPLNLEPLFAQANFYEGKTVRIIVGNLLGATHDLFARAYPRSMGKYMPGNPAIIVQNMPGAGGMIAANEVDEQTAETFEQNSNGQVFRPVPVSRH